MQIDPVHQHRIGIAQMVRYTLPELGQKAALQASRTHTCQQGVQIVFRQASRRVPHSMRCFTCCFAFSNVVSHPAQVFKQHHPQCGWHGPQLAQTELIDFLVSAQKGGKKSRIQHTVGMRYIGPGNTVNTRQAFKRLACQLGQVSVVMSGHTLVNLLKLCFYQVKIVQQPFSSGRDVLAALRNGGNIVVGLAQCGNIVFDPREEGEVVAPPRRFSNRLRLRKTAAVFFEALRAKKLRTNQRLWSARVDSKYFSGVRT